MSEARPQEAFKALPTLIDQSPRSKAPASLIRAAWGFSVDLYLRRPITERLIFGLIGPL